MFMNNLSVRCYILSRDRKQFLIKTLESVLYAGFKTEEIFISDNSTNVQVMQAILQQYPHMPHMRNGGALTGPEHGRRVVEHFHESSYDHALFFHDDDLLLPDAKEKILTYATQFRDAAAISFDGYILKNEKRLRLHGRNRDLTSPEKISSNQVLKYQFDFWHQAINPFPAILYNRTWVDTLLKTQDIGKHTDVRYMLDLAAIDFVLSSVPIMDYRFHDDADRVDYNRKDFLRLYRYCKHIPTNAEGHDALRDLRWRLYAREIARAPKKLYRGRSLSFIIFIIRGLVRYMFGSMRRTFR